MAGLCQRKKRTEGRRKEREAVRRRQREKEGTKEKVKMPHMGRL